MRIRDNVIYHINEKMGLKAQLCAEFNKHFATIQRWINRNDEDGPLTTAKALQLIAKETGLANKDILEKEVVAK